MIFICNVKKEHPVCIFRGPGDEVCVYQPPGACVFKPTVTPAEAFVTDLRKFVNELDTDERNCLTRMIERMEDNDGKSHNK
jgi:hypothetical protein